MQVALPTKTEVDRRSSEYQYELLSQHKRLVNKLSAGKNSMDDIDHSSTDLKRASSQNEIKLNIKEIGEGINISVKHIPSLKEDLRRSSDNNYAIRNKSKFTTRK